METVKDATKLAVYYHEHRDENYLNFILDAIKAEAIGGSFCMNLYKFNWVSSPNYKQQFSWNENVIKMLRDKGFEVSIHRKDKGILWWKKKEQGDIYSIWVSWCRET